MSDTGTSSLDRLSDKVQAGDIVCQRDGADRICDQKKYIKSRMMFEDWTIHGVEAALHGQACIQELRREMRFARIALVPVYAHGDKFTKALAWAARAEEGKVVLVRQAGPSYTSKKCINGMIKPYTPPHERVSSLTFPTENHNWIEEFLEEICSFPNSPHDDQLDGISDERYRSS